MGHPSVRGLLQEPVEGYFVGVQEVYERKARGMGVSAIGARLSVSSA
jgi:hypothetical protein